ncbi:MAG: M23 family metallopeptidase [Candidatus Magasanikbacteria bacterium]
MTRFFNVKLLVLLIVITSLFFGFTSLINDSKKYKFKTNRPKEYKKKYNNSPKDSFKYTKRKQTENQKAPDEKRRQNIFATKLSSTKVYQGNTLSVVVNTQTKKGFNPRVQIFNTSSTLIRVGSKKWAGFFGIDAQKRAGNYSLHVHLSDKEKVKTFEVLQKDFSIEELAVTRELQKKGYSEESLTKHIIQKENKIMDKVLSTYTPHYYFEESFVRPLNKMKVVSKFGTVRKSKNSALQHLGVDLRAKKGTPVRSINGGVVRFAKKLNLYGKTIMIDHGYGLFSLYLHLQSIDVSKGQKVEKGELIGKTGGSGYSFGPHLHFSIKQNKRDIDPLQFIEKANKLLKS